MCQGIGYRGTPRYKGGIEDMENKRVRIVDIAEE